MEAVDGEEARTNCGHEGGELTTVDTESRVRVVGLPMTQASYNCIVLTEEPALERRG